jgi:hypothetical protein
MHPRSYIDGLELTPTDPAMTTARPRDVDSKEKLSVQEEEQDASLETGSEGIVDWSLEKRLLRKLDWTLIPLFMLICELFHDTLPCRIAW